MRVYVLMVHVMYESSNLVDVFSSLEAAMKSKPDVHFDLSTVDKGSWISNQIDDETCFTITEKEIKSA